MKRIETEEKPYGAKDQSSKDGASGNENGDRGKGTHSGSNENGGRSGRTHIRKKFHKQLFSRFAKAVRDYQLVQENDRIAVCISGGKDSMLLAKLFQELQKHRKVPFELQFLVMDPGYLKANRTLIEENAKRMGIPVTIFETEIFDAVYEIEKSPCYLCARMRRGHLYIRQES